MVPIFGPPCIMWYYHLLWFAEILQLLSADVLDVLQLSLSEIWLIPDAERSLEN